MFICLFNLYLNISWQCTLPHQDKCLGVVGKIGTCISHDLHLDHGLAGEDSENSSEEP